MGPNTANTNTIAASGPWSGTSFTSPSLPTKETAGLWLGAAKIVCFCNHLEGTSTHAPFDPTLHLSPEQTKAYYAARIDDRNRFCGYRKANEARRLARDAAIEVAAQVLGRGDRPYPKEPITASKQQQLAATAYSSMVAYFAAASGKIGIRGDITVENGTARFKAVNVPFVRYRMLAKRDTDPALLEHVAVSGAAMILRTSDNKLVIQYRSEKNYPYGGGLGASVAGYLDAERSLPATQTGRVGWGPDPVTDETVLKRYRAEGAEEIGLPADSLKFGTKPIQGIAWDSYSPHHEILIFGQSVMPSDELRKRAEANQLKKLPPGTTDITENIAFIEASPKAILALLGKVQCPIPPSHAAAFLAAGSAMVDEWAGISAAKAWRQEAAEVAHQNYAAIDAKVQAYYLANPEEFFRVPTKFAAAFTKFANEQSGNVDAILGTNEVSSYSHMMKLLGHGSPSLEILAHARLVHAAVCAGVLPERNPSGYAPTYLPKEQGLPDQREEMRRVFGV